MKTLQTMTSSQNFISAAKVTTENLPTGESISKAVTMGKKICCGSSYKEQANK